MTTFEILLTIAFMLSFVQADTCGGNCPSNDCSDCRCGYSKQMVDIAQACQQVGWSQSCCQCIVQKESEGNAHAQNQNTDGTVDVGLFQIDSVNWPACNGGNAPCDVNQNIACAKMVYGYAGNRWSPWATCGACGCCGSNFLDVIDI